MNSYNGYEPKERYAALAWLKKEWAAGTREKTPSSCDICTQQDGYLAYHSEDYSFPYGDHIGRFGLCYICHMMLHCRYKSPIIMKMYIEALEENKCYEPIHGNGWQEFRNSCLVSKFKNRSYKIVKSNNIELYKSMINGDYITESKDSYKPAVGSLF